MKYKSAVGFDAKLICATHIPEGEYMVEAAEPNNSQLIRGSITLGRGASISSGATVCISRKCKDIVIGDYTVIGTGSYIDRSIPANMIIHPKITYESRFRFTCATGFLSGCSRDDCPIYGSNWHHCGYLTKDVKK